MSTDFTPQERAVLRIVQGDLPHSLTPYADVAAACGVPEEDVLGLLRRLKSCGAIRRFGASIRHQRSGWTHNAMVAWVATIDEADRCGREVARDIHISHAYFRPGVASDWPYTLYTMVHGRSDAEIMEVIEDLAVRWRLPHAILRSVRELKKTSMTYFS